MPEQDQKPQELKAKLDQRREESRSEGVVSEVDALKSDNASLREQNTKLKQQLEEREKEFAEMTKENTRLASEAKGLQRQAERDNESLIPIKCRRDTILGGNPCAIGTAIAHVRLRDGVSPTELVDAIKEGGRVSVGDLKT